MVTSSTRIKLLSLTSDFFRGFILYKLRTFFRRCFRGKEVWSMPCRVRVKRSGITGNSQRLLRLLAISSA